MNRTTALSPTLASWLHPLPHDDRRSVDLVRIALAVILFTHPAHALLHHGDASDLARGLEAHGLPHGLAFAWGALVVQLVACVALVIPRLVVPGAIGSLAVVAGGGSILYMPRWYVVGGNAADGQPGIELNALLTACLVAVLWTYWPRSGGEIAKQRAAATGLEIIRIASALSLLAHAIGAPSDAAGMHAWGEAMSAKGWPCGIALVWSIKGIELVGCVLRLARRLVVPACFGHLSYLVPGMWMAHQLDWFDVGPGENGVEFSVLIIVCTVACILAYWPQRAATAAPVQAGTPSRDAQPSSA